MKIVDCYKCLLTDDYKCENARNEVHNSKKSVGKNVAIILRNHIVGMVPMRMYEPNEVINMSDIRIGIANITIKDFTQHT